MPRDSPSPLASLFAGSVAGGIEAFITYPFEFAKTQVQLQHTSGAILSPRIALQQVITERGISGIYTGCSSLVIGCMAKAGVRFLAFDSIKNALSDSSGRLSAGRGIVAGLGAGVLESVIAVTPTERIKTALIDDSKGQRRFQSPLHAVRSIVHERGPSELYRGLLSTTLKQGATSAVRMGSYNAIKEASHKFNMPQNAASTFAMGGTAGIITVYATQPLDTIKTRAQSAAGASPTQAFTSVLRESGVTGFWKGSSMRLGRLVLSGGIIFTVYEQTLALLQFPTAQPQRVTI